MTQRIAAASVLAAFLIPLGANAATTTMTVKSAQTFAVPGTSVTARVAQVVDFTSQGCEGGPQGCPDRVVLTVTNGKASTTITLYVPHTASQRSAAVDRKTVYGVQFILTSVHLSTASLQTVNTP